MEKKTGTTPKTNKGPINFKSFEGISPPFWTVYFSDTQTWNYSIKNNVLILPMSKVGNTHDMGLKSTMSCRIPNLIYVKENNCVQQNLKLMW